MLETIIVIFTISAITYIVGYSTGIKESYQKGFKDGADSIELEQALIIVQKYQDRMIRARQYAAECRIIEREQQPQQVVLQRWNHSRELAEDQ